MNILNIIYKRKLKNWINETQEKKTSARNSRIESLFANERIVSLLENEYRNDIVKYDLESFTDFNKAYKHIQSLILKLNNLQYKVKGSFNKLLRYSIGATFQGTIQSGEESRITFSEPKWFKASTKNTNTAVWSPTRIDKIISGGWWTKLDKTFDYKNSYMQFYCLKPFPINIVTTGNHRTFTAIYESKKDILFRFKLGMDLNEYFKNKYIFEDYLIIFNIKLNMVVDAQKITSKTMRELLTSLKYFSEKFNLTEKEFLLKFKD